MMHDVYIVCVILQLRFSVYTVYMVAFTYFARSLSQVDPTSGTPRRLQAKSDKALALVWLAPSTLSAALPGMKPV